jgi:hypothetical protein
VDVFTELGRMLEKSRDKEALLRNVPRGAEGTFKEI